MIIPKDHKKLLVTCSHKLIEARYSLTVSEQRLVLLMISMIEPNDEDFKDYEIGILDFLNLLDLTGKDNYKRMKGITESLVSKVIKIEEEKSLLQVSWLSSAEYLENMGVVKLSFDPKLKPYLLQLKSHFTKYHLAIAIRFRSIYTIRIYTLLKSNQYIGYVDFYYQDLRAILGLEKNKYPLYKDFKKWVLNQAKKELEERIENKIFKSDVSFRLEVLERKNRKIHKIRLYIIEQKNQEPLPIEIKNKQSTKKNPIIEKLNYHGIGVKQANILLKEYKDTIQDSIILFEQNLANNKINKNKQGYLVALIKSRVEGQSQYEKDKQDAEIKEIKQKNEQENEKQKKIDKFHENTIKLFSIIEQIDFNYLKEKVKNIMANSPFMKNLNGLVELQVIEYSTTFDQLRLMLNPDSDRSSTKYILRILQEEYLPK